MLTQSPQFFETLQTGEVLSRLTGDTTLIQTVVGSSASMGLRSLFQFVGGMIMLAVTSFYLFAINVGLMILLILPIMMIGRSVKKLSRESQDRIADSLSLIHIFHAQNNNGIIKMKHPMLYFKEMCIRDSC